MSASVDDRRPAELVASLAAVRARLADAATAAGRDPWSVTLIAVTKTFPAADVAILLGLGVARHRREPRPRGPGEARPAAGQSSRATRSRRADARAALHFIGRLQTNKCRSVARYADCVHTVDRPAVADALADGVEAPDASALPVFVQVSLDGDPARGGLLAPSWPRWPSMSPPMRVCDCSA